MSDSSTRSLLDRLRAVAAHHQNRQIEQRFGIEHRKLSRYLKAGYYPKNKMDPKSIAKITEIVEGLEGEAPPYHTVSRETSPSGLHEWLRIEALAAQTRADAMLEAERAAGARARAAEQSGAATSTEGGRMRTCNGTQSREG